MVPEECAPRRAQHGRGARGGAATATWRCWLAAELAAAAAARGLHAAGRPRSRRTRPSGGRRWCSSCSTSSRPTPARPDGSIDAERFPNFARAGGDLHLVPERPHRLRLDLQGGARDPRRAHAAARGRRRTCAATSRASSTLMDRLGYERVQGGVGHGGLPAVDLPGCAHAAAGRARAAGRRRAAGPPAQVDRRDPRSGRSRPSTSSTRCCRTSRGSTCPRDTRAARPANDPIEDLNRAGGFDDPGLTDHNHLRHLLQVGYTDRQLGRVLQRLGAPGLLERALFVVTADHGYAFEVGVKERGWSPRRTSSRSRRSRCS